MVAPLFKIIMGLT